MKKCSIFLAFAFLQLAGNSQTGALPNEIKASLRTAQLGMFNSFCNADVETFLKFTGDDYITINADGSYMGPGEMAALLPKFKGSTFKILDQTDRFYNNIAISTGRAKFYFGPMLAADVYFTQAWIFRNGNWSYIAWQGTMTGLPTYYPVISVLVLIGLGTLIAMLVIRKIRKKNQRAGSIGGLVFNYNKDQIVRR